MDTVCNRTSDVAIAAARLRIAMRTRIKAQLFSEQSRSACTEDAVQDAFVGLLRACERLKEKPSDVVASYLLRTAKNAALSCGRKLSKAPNTPIDEDDVMDLGLNAEEGMLSAEQEANEKTIMHRLVDTLTPQERRVFQGLLAEKSQEEIASSLGLTAGRVSQLKAQIRRKWDALRT